MRHFASSFRFGNFAALSRSASVMRVGRPLAVVLLAGMTLLTAALAAPIERFQVNLPPETVLSSGPPDSTASTNYRVHFFWSGTDPNGLVDHFDFILVDHPRSNDSIGPGGADPVIVTVPEPDDPRWTSTTLTDSIFVTVADTLRRDPRPGPGESPSDVLQHPFERWHSFFVRAVDDEGLADPTPDYRSFNANNLAPTVALQPPVLAGPGAEFSAPPDIVFHWEGEDPVDETTTIEPVASRFVLISSAVSIFSQEKYVSFPESLYVLPTQYEWSPWRAWDAADGSGRRAAVSNLLRVGDAPGAGYYLFAVQAMDEAGAITPVFDYKTVGINNCARVRVSGANGPLLTVHEDVLGTALFVDGSISVEIDIGAEQPVHFHWSADASHYGGTIMGYRYGWDIIDPEDDQQWSSWSVDNTSAPTQAFAAGTHVFSLQTRDDLQSSVTASFELIVNPVTMSRDFLWVDDSDHLTDAVTESFESSRWASVLETVTINTDLEFDPDLDVYDVQMDVLQRPPSLGLMLDHRVVVWSVRAGADGSSGLRRTAQFFDPIPVRNQNTARNFNALKVYVANGGRLWINGFQPARQLWPAEREPGLATAPVNVTHWDDPIEPHPQVDSVGTTSVLYEMGVEMFDLGASAGFPRSQSQHYCYGLHPAVPNVPELGLSSTWSQGGTGGRSNIEIYDMPQALATQVPPLVPPAGKTRVVYIYVSGVLEADGFTYPETADRQPVLVVTKTALDDTYPSMALCGFEPYLLEYSSHVDLARHVLLREMGLWPTPVFLQSFSVVFMNGAVRIDWQLDDSSDPAEFLLRARSGDTEWTVPFAALGARTFAATDESPHLSPGKSVIYSLYAREGDAQWIVLAQETVVLAETPPKLQLLAPQPNPFNPRVVIPFVLPAAQRVRVSIYSADGRKITTLVDAIRPAGPGSVLWDGTDASGRPAASGLYVARLESAGAWLSRKLVLMK